jgi:hypothetical protein
MILSEKDAIHVYMGAKGFPKSSNNAMAELINEFQREFIAYQFMRVAQK